MVMEYVNDDTVYVNDSPDIIEIRTVEEANAIDKTIYRLERFSEARDCYIFIKRRGK